MAWTSPLPMVRFNPVRISFPSIAACKFLVSIITNHSNQFQFGHWPLKTRSPLKNACILKNHDAEKIAEEIWEILMQA